MNHRIAVALIVVVAIFLSWLTINSGSLGRVVGSTEASQIFGASVCHSKDGDITECVEGCPTPGDASHAVSGSGQSRRTFACSCNCIYSKLSGDCVSPPRILLPK